MISRIASLFLTALSVALLLQAPGRAVAASGYVEARVIRVLMVGDNTFGGCMAALSVDPKTAVPTCQSWWVTFSCSGDFTDAVRAYRMVDLAELALATGKTAGVFFSR